MKFIVHLFHYDNQLTPLSVLTYLIFKGIFDAIKFVKINNKMLNILIKILSFKVM
jgi:hypothetical protein